MRFTLPSFNSTTCHFAGLLMDGCLIIACHQGTGRLIRARRSLCRITARLSLRVSSALSSKNVHKTLLKQRIFSSSMSYLSQLLTSLVAVPLAYGAYKFLLFFYAQWTSPLRVLPGPPSTSLLYGNMKEIWKAVCTLSVTLIHVSYTYVYCRRALSCTKNGSMNMDRPLGTRPSLE